MLRTSSTSREAVGSERGRSDPADRLTWSPSLALPRRAVAALRCMVLFKEVWREGEAQEEAAGSCPLAAPISSDDSACYGAGTAPGRTALQLRRSPHRPVGLSWRSWSFRAVVPPQTFSRQRRSLRTLYPRLSFTTLSIRSPNLPLRLPALEGGAKLRASVASSRGPLCQPGARLEHEGSALRGRTPSKKILEFSSTRNGRVEFPPRLPAELRSGDRMRASTQSALRWSYGVS